jgi:hypothetical protein
VAAFQGGLFVVRRCAQNDRSRRAERFDSLLLKNIALAESQRESVFAISMLRFMFRKFFMSAFASSRRD